MWTQNQGHWTRKRIIGTVWEYPNIFDWLAPPQHTDFFPCCSLSEAFANNVILSLINYVSVETPAATNWRRFALLLLPPHHTHEAPSAYTHVLLHLDYAMPRTLHEPCALYSASYEPQILCISPRLGVVTFDTK